MAKNNDSEKQYLFDNPKNIKRLLYGFYVCCLALIIIELFVDRHSYLAAESVFGFYALYGFIGCVFLVLASKVLRKMVMRDEDYYDRFELKFEQKADSNKQPHQKTQGDSQHVDD